jgi:hypothetical protein
MKARYSKGMWSKCLLIGICAIVVGCSSSAKSDALSAADAQADAPVDASVACYPLFHACTATEQCCVPNRCLNITGNLACQQEGPAPDADQPDATGDANQSQVDGPAAGDAVACYPLFHACSVTEQCCAPNRCLNITGTPACQQEGPR